MAQDQDHTPGDQVQILCGMTNILLGYAQEVKQGIVAKHGNWSLKILCGYGVQTGHAEDAVLTVL